MEQYQLDYATKEQVGHVEQEQVNIKADIKVMQHDISSIKEAMATKTDIANLRADLANVKYDILKWIVPMFLGIILATLYK